MTRVSLSSIHGNISSAPEYDQYLILNMFFDYLNKPKKQLRPSNGTIYNNINPILRFLQTLDITKRPLFTFKIAERFIINQTTRTTYTSVMKNFARFCYLEKYIDHEIKELILSIRSPKNIKPENEESRKIAIPKDQWENVYEQLQYETQRYFCWFAFNFGLRLGELTNLKWKHVNLNKKIISIKRHGQGIEAWEPKTENGIREIPINDEQLQIIKEYKKSCEELQMQHEYVIYSPMNRTKANEKVIQEWLKKVKIEIDGYDKPIALRPHICRYSYAVALFTKLSYKGLHIISKLLGHKNMATTEQYLRISEKEILEKKREAMNAL